MQNYHIVNKFQEFALTIIAKFQNFKITILGYLLKVSNHAKFTETICHSIMNEWMNK